MKTLKWKRNKKPIVEKRRLQYDLVENNKYESNIVIGSIWLSSNGEWMYEIKDDWDWLEVNTLKDAKKEFLEVIREYYSDELDYFHAGIEELEEYLELIDNLI